MADQSHPGPSAHRLPALTRRPRSAWRWLALISAYVNVAVMFLAAPRLDTPFWLAYAGAVLSFYGFMALREEERG